MAAKRGQCSVCRYRHPLRKDGTIQAHPVYCGSERRECEGAGKPPRQDNAATRAEDAFGQIGGELHTLRLMVAQRRDDLLTEAEQIAMLEVYEEFGR